MDEFEDGNHLGGDLQTVESVIRHLSFK